jgi:plasmid stability protein
MSQVVVRNLEEGVKAGLKKRASLHGWSMEEEARQILRKAVLAASSSEPLGSRIVARFAGCGLVEDLPELHGQIIADRDFNLWDAGAPPG